MLLFISFFVSLLVFYCLVLYTEGKVAIHSGLRKTIIPAKDVDNILLIDYPMIMAHDAASGELDENRDHIVADWARTQSAGLVGQLDCGARAFDYRPSLSRSDNNTMIYPHHGGIVIHTPMSSSLKDIINWLNSHPDELVVLYLSHFDGDGCEDEVAKLLESFHIYTIRSNDCTSAFSTLTYGQAKKLGQVTPRLNSGSLVAVYDCTEEYYDSTMNCYSKDYTCYDSWPDNTASIPMTQLETYMENLSKSNPTSKDKRFWMIQGHWQSTAGSITLGTLHKSNIIEDEKRSKVNNMIESNIRAGKYPFINYMELDEVCDNGLQVLNAIKQVYLS